MGSVGASCVGWCVARLGSGARRRRGASGTAFPRGSVGTRCAALVGVSRGWGVAPGGDAERRGRHSHAGAWERVVLRWLLCGPTGERRRGATRSVGDGIPTRERGNELCCVGWCVDRLGSGAGGRRGASGTAFPRGAWERVVLRWLVCRPTGEWRRDAERRGRHSHAGAWERVVVAWLPCRPTGEWRREATRSVEDGIPTRERGNELCCVGWCVARLGSGAGRRRGASGTAFPRGAWERVVLRWLVCRPTGEWRRGATRSVEDGIPTRERGNELLLLGCCVDRLGSGAGGRRGASGTAFPRRAWERVVVAWLPCRPTGEWRRGPTRCVGDGIPTRERWNEGSRSHSVRTRTREVIVVQIICGSS